MRGECRHWVFDVDGHEYACCHGRYLSVSPPRDREDFIHNTLSLPEVPCEQRFCSKQNTVDILLGVCDRMPELACIPDVLMHKVTSGGLGKRRT